MEKEFDRWMNTMDDCDKRGVRSATFEYGSETVGSYYVGTYDDFGEKKSVKFSVFDYSEDNWNYCRNIAKLSRNSKCSYVLVPMLVEKTFDGKSIVMGFDFDKSDVSHKGEAFDKSNAILCYHWRRHIWHLLDTIDQMHAAGVYHGNLDKSTCYVYRGEFIYIIGPTKEASSEPTQSKLQLDDIECFEKFLRDNLVVNHSSEDLNSYYQLCRGFFNKRPRVSKMIQCLKNHPLLMGSYARFRYYWHWVDCCCPTRNVDPRDKSLFLSQLRSSLSKYMPWKDRLNDDFLKFFDSKPAHVRPYNVTKATHFIRFIRNALKHFFDKNFKLVEIFERDLDEMYPGLLGVLHNLLALLDIPYYGLAGEKNH